MLVPIFADLIIGLDKMIRAVVFDWLLVLEVEQQKTNVSRLLAD